MSGLAEANKVASYLNKWDDAIHKLAVQVHDQGKLGLVQIQLGTHARLYINEKLRIVNYASKIMSIGTEQATTRFPQSSVVEIGRGKLLDYLWSISVLDYAMCASAVET